MIEFNIKKCSHVNLRLFSQLQETLYYKGFISNIIQRQSSLCKTSIEGK